MIFFKPLKLIFLIVLCLIMFGCIQKGKFYNNRLNLLNETTSVFFDKEELLGRFSSIVKNNSLFTRGIIQFNSMENNEFVEVLYTQYPIKKSINNNNDLIIEIPCIDTSDVVRIYFNEYKTENVYYSFFDYMSVNSFKNSFNINIENNSLLIISINFRPIEIPICDFAQLSGHTIIIDDCDFSKFKGGQILKTNEISEYSCSNYIPSHLRVK